ncbi:MAG: SRPBCC family protein [Fibrobacterota bacterium]|nr:SRPBCC family protein [Fibrobacterota bacterium]QQS07752.1 MAG: SRPBCC family protein [Fibrobacterota bacterium]
MRTLTMETRLPGLPEQFFPFFSDARNLSRITPSELGFRILTPGPIAMSAGTLIDYRIGLWGLPMRWRTRIATWNPPRAFSDEQIRGPYKRWFHTHTFAPDGNGGTIMTDSVEFALPLEPLSLLVRPMVEWQVRRIFLFRDRALREALGLPTASPPPDIRITTA